MIGSHNTTTHCFLSIYFLVILHAELLAVYTVWLHTHQYNQNLLTGGGLLLSLSIKSNVILVNSLNLNLLLVVSSWCNISLHYVMWTAVMRVHGVHDLPLPNLPTYLLILLLYFLFLSTTATFWRNILECNIFHHLVITSQWISEKVFTCSLWNM